MTSSPIASVITCSPITSNHAVNKYPLGSYVLSKSYTLRYDKSPVHLGKILLL